MARGVKRCRKLLTLSQIGGAILYAGLILHVNPPSDIETIDPKTLHLSAEFTEANLGTKVEAGGQVTTRIVATQFAFDPQCVVVPANEPVTLRLASPDVIHGILVTGTNVLRGSGPHRLHQDRSFC